MDMATRVVQNSYLSIPDSQAGLVRLNRRGEGITADFITQACLDGRVFCANAGTVTTPATWTATATIDVTKPVLAISVPLGTTIIPIEIDLYMEAFGTTAQFECMAEIGTGGTASGTAVTPTNLRSDAPNTSACSVYKLGTAATGPTVNVSEFWRNGQQFAITKSAGSATAAASDPNRFTWRLLDGQFTPVVVGAGQLFLMQGSQAGTGFAKIIYVELPSVSAV